MAAARDGSIQLGFGLGKYTNRNVMDAYAGMSRGVEQMTVRASRRLAPDPELHRASARSATRSSSRCGRSASCSSPTTSSRSPSTGSSRRRSRRSSRTATHIRAGLPRLGRPRPLPPDRPLLGLGRDRRRAHRADARHLGLDPRPLVGRPLRRRRADRTDVEPAAD